MRQPFVVLIAAGIAGTAAPALAADGTTTPNWRLSGAAALLSDYRLRGVSQTDKTLAVQGSLAVAHRSGLYASLFAANLAGWGTFGGPDLELDLIGGIKLPLAGGTLDTGMTWYMYPGGADTTDYAELFAKLSGTIGPLSVLGGVAYAPRQQALGRWYDSGAAYQAGVPERPGAGEDNLYLWGDVSAGIPGLPVTAKAHIGYSDGNPGLGPNGTSVAPTGRYWDWLIGADAALGAVVLGLAYIDTDIDRRGAGYRRLQPNFAKTSDGSPISGGTVVFSVTAAF